jgi:hypothetical protein
MQYTSDPFAGQRDSNACWPFVALASKRPRATLSAQSFF